MAQMNDLTIDLEGEDDDFKKWFNQQITQTMNQSFDNKNSVVLLTLNTNTPLSSDINKRKIKEIILSSKAFDPKYSCEEVICHENIIKFLRETIIDLYRSDYDYESLIEMSERIKNHDFIDGDVTVDDVWAGLLQSIADYTKWLTRFSQKFPGFHVFDNDDLFHIVHGGVLPLFTLRYNVLYNREINENFTLLSNGIIYSKKNINLLFDKYLANLVVLFFKKCSALSMSEGEKALFYPFVLLSCDINLIKAKDYLIDLKSYYVSALIHEFKLNNRDEKFSKDLMEFFKVILVLEINKENYRCRPKQDNNIQKKKF